MYKSLLAGFVVSVALMGCGSTANDTDTVAKVDNQSNDGEVCKLEKRVGSNMMRRVCYTEKEREQMREAAKEGMLRMQRSSETGGADQ